jgi:tripartite-type tricarboxylate transporter receptor subunit TctC
MSRSMISRFTAALVVSALAFASVAQAQEFPNKPVRVVLPLAPGSIPDLVVRTMAPAISKTLGQPVIVENKTGASGLIAFEYVAKQMPADGYTLLVTNHSLATARAFVKTLSFDPVSDLPAISFLVSLPVVLGANPDRPWKTFNEMIAFAKANPGQLNFGTSGVYTTLTLFTHAINLAQGVNIVPVPYKGGSPQTMPAVMSNEIQMTLLTEQQVVTNAGKIRAIAVTGNRRMASFPDVPTFAELKVPAVVGVDYVAHVAKGTPKAAIDKWYAALASALQAEDVKAVLAKNGFVIIGSNPADAEKRYLELERTFLNLAQKVGIQPE